MGVLWDGGIERIPVEVGFAIRREDSVIDSSIAEVDSRCCGSASDVRTAELRQGRDLLGARSCRFTPARGL